MCVRGCKSTSKGVYKSVLRGLKTTRHRPVGQVQVLQDQHKVLVQRNGLLRGGGEQVAPGTVLEEAPALLVHKVGYVGQEAKGGQLKGKGQMGQGG